MQVVPGALLGFVSLVVFLAIGVAVIRHPEMIVSLVLLAVPLGILWGVWSELPSWFRTFVYRMLKRRRERREGGDSR